jgi:hypothetical protein
VRGADATIDFSKFSKTENPKARVEAGFSYITRYQQYTGPEPDFPATVRAAAARLSVSSAVVSLGLEYVHKGKDPSVNNNQDMGDGKALLVNASVAAGKFGMNLTLRSISNMDFRGERDAIATSVPVNFIPALTRPHDYLTTNIYVYNAQAQGEIGGQADLYYTVNKNAKKPSRIGINFSHYRSLQTKNNIFSAGKNAYFRDLSIEWKKKWSNKINSIIAYHNLFYNKSVVEGGIYNNINANIILLNTTYRYAAKKSFRFELQHLFTKDDNGNWAAAVTEFNFAPSFSFYVSDLYNYDVTNTHYPNIGGSYTKSGSRFSLAYGRQRAGLFCVGGICRFVPAATAVTATLTITFNSK